MPKKGDSKKSNKKNKVIEEEPQNSEEEYASESDGSDMSGGEAPDVDPESELDNDDSNLEIDEDDDNNPDADEKYDPINDASEPEDPDDAEDAEEEGEGEAEVVEEGEIEAGDEIVENDEYGVEGRQCHLKNLNKDFIVLDEDDSNMYGKMEYTAVPPNERETDKIMTYYEMVRIIGTRAQQFNLGAEPLLKDVHHLHPAKIAYLELISKMTPYIIRRHLPGKKYEDFAVDELEIIHEITDDFFVPENFDWDAFMKQVTDANKAQEAIFENTRVKPQKKAASKSKKNSKAK